MDYKTLLGRLVDGSSLSEEEAFELALELIEGKVPDVLVSAILIALRMKGETAEEIAGFAKALRSKATRVPLSHAIDVVGTGGDGLGTLNVSTASAILASIEHPVAKHGNRAVSGKTGSADLLETLGYKIEVEPDRAVELLEKTGFVFLFAPLYHKGVARVAPIRRALGVRTIFNIIGPLANPGGTRRQVIGVASRSLAKTVAEAVARLDFEKALVIHGEPGIDEASVSGQTLVYEVRGSKVDYYTIHPRDFRLQVIPVERLLVTSPEDSALRIIRAARGLDRDAASFIELNTALALYVADVVEDLADGLEYSRILIAKLVDKLYEIIIGNGDIDRLKSLLVKAG